MHKRHCQRGQMCGHPAGMIPGAAWGHDGLRGPGKWKERRKSKVEQYLRPAYR